MERSSKKFKKKFKLRNRILRSCIQLNGSPWLNLRLPQPGSINAPPRRVNTGGTSQSVSGNPQGMQSMRVSSGNQAGTNSNQGSWAIQANSMGASPGGSGLADLYRVQIEIGELENNISLLKSQLTTITARFNTYLNRPSLSPVHLLVRLSPIPLVRRC